jgi:competence protein ComEC
VAPGIARFLADGASVLLRVLDACAAAAAAVPGGHAFVSPAVVTAWLAAAGVVIVANRLRMAGDPAQPTRNASENRSRIAILRLAWVGSAAVFVVTAWPVVAGRNGGALEIHAIDVGQGDAFAVRTPEGRWLVIDTGPRTATFDAGRSRVVPFLLRHDAKRLAALILTHPDGDHIGGAQAILDVFDVDVVIDPGTAVGKGQYVATLDAARQHGTRWLAARSGREMRLDDLVIRFLAPDEQVLDSQRDANDFSVVFRLGYGRFGALFLGDAPAWVEDRIVARDGPSIASDMIKVGHHGSRTSTGDSLLDAVSARVALISVGRRNRYGHPAPAVIERLGRHGVRILRTDESGSIMVRVGADGRMTLSTTR